MSSSEERYREICPLCAKGVKVRQRTDSLEWVHDYVINKLTNGVVQGHALCQANDLRKQNG